MMGYAAVARSIKDIHLKCAVYINNVERISSYLTEKIVCITKTDHSKMFRKITNVYCENHTNHANTLCGQNAEF
jgi:hypothetical protein